MSQAKDEQPSEHETSTIQRGHRPQCSTFGTNGNRPAEVHKETSTETETGTPSQAISSQKRKPRPRRCAREDILTPEQLSHLHEATQSTREQAWVLLMSRWGLRASEAAHLNPAWVSTQEGTLRIPGRCRCPTCKAEEPWGPKTPSGKRALPLREYDPKTWAAVLAYLQEYGHDPCSRQAVGKAVKRVADRALLEERVYPHALRATAAQQFADAGFTEHRLCRVMGWSDGRSARPYIDASRATLDGAFEDHPNPWWTGPEV